MHGLKVWFLETRPQFLTLSLVLAFLGTVVAWYDDYFSLWRALLAGFGLTGQRLRRWEGAVLLALYLGYLALAIRWNIAH